MPRFSKKPPARGRIFPYPEIFQTAAGMECTGLMPVVPDVSEEWLAYQQLFSMEVPPPEVWHRK